MDGLLELAVAEELRVGVGPVVAEVFDGDGGLAFCHWFSFRETFFHISIPHAVVGVGYVCHGLTRLSESNSIAPGESLFVSLTLHSNGIPSVVNVLLNEAQAGVEFITNLDSNSNSCRGETTCIKTVPDFPAE